jgi:hypothetical protein
MLTLKLEIKITASNEFFSHQYGKLFYHYNSYSSITLSFRNRKVSILSSYTFHFEFLNSLKTRKKKEERRNYFTSISKSHQLRRKKSLNLQPNNSISWYFHLGTLQKALYRKMTMMILLFEQKVIGKK